MPDATDTKKQRLNQISKWICQGLNGSKIVNVELLKVRIQFEIGLSLRKTEEYVKLCVDAHEEWKEDHGSIVLKKVEA